MFFLQTDSRKISYYVSIFSLLLFVSKFSSAEEDEALALLVFILFSVVTAAAAVAVAAAVTVVTLAAAAVAVTTLSTVDTLHGTVELVEVFEEILTFLSSPMISEELLVNFRLTDTFLVFALALAGICLVGVCPRVVPAGVGVT